MARELLNTLYVTTQGAYVHVDGQTLRVEVEDETRLRVPLHHLGSVVCFGRVSVSPEAIARCAEDQRDLVFLRRSGRFRARVVGPTSGNILLRLAQHRAYEDSEKAIAVARNIVAAKVQNTRILVMREARQTEDKGAEKALRDAAKAMARTIQALPEANDMDAVRGHEGYAGAAYFSVFHQLIRTPDPTFTFDGRNRRPPRDPVNALLSFLYSLIRVECQAACEGVGLDPQLGFSARRPSRPAIPGAGPPRGVPNHAGRPIGIDSDQSSSTNRQALFGERRRRNKPQRRRTEHSAVGIPETQGRGNTASGNSGQDSHRIDSAPSGPPSGSASSWRPGTLSGLRIEVTNMWVLVTYDVNTETAEGRSRLRRVAKTCEDYGQRVQKSVFECTVNDVTFHQMKSRLLKIIDEGQDSVRFYKLPGSRDKRVEEYGQGDVIDFSGPLLV